MKPRILSWFVLVAISIYLLPAKGIDYPSEYDETEESIQDLSGNSTIVTEGDILVATYPEGFQSGSVSDVKRTWPNATIPYIISDEYDEKQGEEIKIAMDAFEAKTCIKFIQRKNQKRYIHIVKSNRNIPCLSYIGRQLMNGQNVYLNEDCIFSPGTVKHELMHAIGFVHEQSRTDRDDHVDIHYDNIVDGKGNGNFFKYKNNLIWHLNTSYDTKSIMHYEWNAFAIDDSKPTITAKDGSNITRNEDFSRTDILEINRLYKCASGQYEWNTSDNNQIQLAKNCSFFGQDIHQEKCSSEECSGLCLANSHCTHFTWDSEDNNCYLSTNSSFIDIYPYKGALCGYIIQRNSNYSWRDWKDGQIKWAPRCDFFGFDFHQQKSGYKECGELCFNNTKCTHFTWEWEGNCYLKTLPKTVNVYPYEKSICGYVNRRKSAITWQDGENKQLRWSEDCDFFGYDFHQVKSKDVECGGLCLSYTKCTHFTWDWEGNCHLKVAPNSTAVYPFKGAVCGYVTQRETSNFVWKDRNSGKIKWANDCDFFGYDIQEQKSEDEECSSLCLANQNCSHFTWDRDGNCYLKNAPKSISMYQLKGAVCGYISTERNTRLVIS